MEEEEREGVRRLTVRDSTVRGQEQRGDGALRMPRGEAGSWGWRGGSRMSTPKGRGERAL